MLFRARRNGCESRNILRSIRWVHTPASLYEEDRLVPNGLHRKPILRLNAAANLDEKRIQKQIEPAIEICWNVDRIARNRLSTNSPNKLGDTLIEGLIKCPN